MSEIFDILRSHAPSSVAVVGADGTSLTYGQLEQNVAARVDRLPGRVGLVLPNGVDLAVSCLAAMAGGGCAPLPVDQPEGQYERDLRALRPDVVVVESGYDGAARAACQTLAIPVVELGDEQPMPSTAPREEALLLLTSGTTSAPKLVGLTESALVRSARNVGATLQLQPGDRCLNVMPLTHIHGLVAALLASLAAGGSVVCTPGFRASEVSDWIEAARPTWYTAVPTIHQAMLDAFRTHPPKDVFRLVRSSSAPLPRRVMAELEDVFGAPVIEAYGMTEAAHQIASNPLPPAVRKPGSVGLPTGVEVSILPDGEVGLRGPTITSGYVDNEEATAAAFVDGWFRTGDTGVLDDDGYLTLTGRIKEIINRGGEKVSPREVDDALLEHEQVEQAAAFAVPHARLGEEVAAAVVLRSGATVTAPQLRTFVAERLAPYKVPRRVLVMDEIPRGRTGKLERRGLASSLGLDQLSAPAVVTPPDTDDERAMAALWRDVLGLDDLPDVTTDFFDLGGDSLHATELLARTEADLGGGLDATIFFTGATVRAMATALSADRSTPHTDASGRVRAIAVQPAGSRPPLFCLLRGGALVSVRHFASGLGPDQPVYGLWAPWMHGGPDAAGTIEDIAAECVAAIRTVRPRGPYALFGYSLGGVVMFDVARQLTNAGDTVTLLALADSSHPTIAEREYRRRRTPRYRARKLFSRRAPEIIGFRVRRALGRHTPKPVEFVPGSDVPLDWTAAIGRERRYVPAPARWPVAIFATPKFLQFCQSPDLGWERELPPGWTSDVVPGDHFTMIGEPYIHELAARLRNALGRALTVAPLPPHHPP